MMNDVEEYSAPRKDDRAKAKRHNYSYNLKTALEVNEKKKMRFLQSVEATAGQTAEEKDFDEFYNGLSKKEKRQYDKLNSEIEKIESKGVTKDSKNSKEKSK